MAPPLNKVFALSLVFADGPLFLGMLNCMNSPLNENVVAIWYYIVLCRGFQMAAAYFMDDVLFVNSVLYDNVNRFKSELNPHARPAAGYSKWASKASASHNPYSDFYSPKTPVSEPRGMASKFSLGFGGSDRLIYDYDVVQNKDSKAYIAENTSHLFDKTTHAAIAVICSHLASLICLITVLYHFINALSIPAGLNDRGTANPVQAVQISFLVIMTVMDVLKHIIALMTTLGKIDQSMYLNIILSTYTADWVLRAIFITVALFPIPDYLGGLNADLYTYFTMAVV